MKVVLSDQVVEALKDAPVPIRRAFEKQVRFLADNLNHPSLHAKKYDESKDRWQARVSTRIGASTSPSSMAPIPTFAVEPDF